MRKKLKRPNLKWDNGQDTPGARIQLSFQFGKTKCLKDFLLIKRDIKGNPMQM